GLKDKDDGTKWRPVYSLGTADKALARRKLARVNAELAMGRDPFEAAERASAPDRVAEYAEAWLTKRKAQGVGMAGKERRNLELHALAALGRVPLWDVRPSHIRSVLEDLAAKGRETKTIAELRGVLNRLFRTALEEELIGSNPVAAVRTPKVRRTRRERAILSDDEFTRFVGCAQVDLELRMMALVARCEGGMRTGDLNRWDWSMIEREAFAECIVPRAKTAKPQALAITEVLAPFLRAWWERAGSPEAGPVFTVSTALAEAGVNVQHAMNLAAHWDPRVHARYVMRTLAMRTVPREALPALPMATLEVAARDDSSPVGADARDDSQVDGPRLAAGIVTARDESRSQVRASRS